MIGASTRLIVASLSACLVGSGRGTAAIVAAAARQSAFANRLEVPAGHPAEPSHGPAATGAPKNTLRHPVFQIVPDALTPPPWTRVEGLRRDQDVVVNLSPGVSLSGRFVAADRTTLTLVVGGDSGPRTIARDAVVSVMARGSSRGSKLGAVLGGGAGLLGGFIMALHLRLRIVGATAATSAH